MTGFLYLTSGTSFESKFNHIQFCNAGLFGVYYLEEVSSISDYGSTYMNNSASTGSVYYILAKTRESATIDIRYCIFKENMAETGGAFALFNYFALFFYGNTFESNYADVGGVFAVSMISSLAGVSTFELK